MKKFFGIAAAVMLCATSAFASGSYAGDCQLLFGAGYDLTEMTFKNDKTDFNNGLIMMSFATHHLWGSSDFFKFGFMASFDGGAGMITKYKVNGVDVSKGDRFIGVKSGMMFGPCIGLGFGNAFRLNVTPGVSLLWCEGASKVDRDNSKLFAEGTIAAGLGLDVQAKFAPKSKVSPILGYRYTVNFSQIWANSEANLKYLDRCSSKHNNSKTDAKFVDKVSIHSHTAYCGISWNW